MNLQLNITIAITIEYFPTAVCCFNRIFLINIMLYKILSVTCNEDQQHMVSNQLDEIKRQWK